jgi:Phosphoribosylformimino-5-aminoimidazole carboxamide ribonucleotide (ProFAR) isomerase
MGEWVDTTIGEVLTLQRGFDITRAHQRSGDIPVVSSGGVGSYHDTAMAKAPGVVIGRKGTLGKTFYLSSDYWPHDTTLWVKDFKGSSSQFVYYFFLQLDVMGLMSGPQIPHSIETMCIRLAYGGQVEELRMISPQSSAHSTTRSPSTSGSQLQLLNSHSPSISP